MHVMDNVINDEVIEGKMYDLVDEFYKECGLEKCDGDITIEGYMQGDEGYFYLAKYRGTPVGSILHFKSQLVISRFNNETRL